VIVKYYEMLDRIEAIKGIERETGRKVVTFYRNALNNHGLIDESVYREFRTAIDSIGSYDPLTVIIHTMGGYTYFGWRIASCLMNRTTSITVVVPEEALSMGTMITLAADEIVMLPDAHLSPIDPQLNHNGVLVPALDLVESTDPLVKANAKRQIELAEENLRQVCESKLSPSKLDALVERFLLKDKRHAAHSSSILFDEVKELELNVKELTLDYIKSLHMQYKRHSFNELDPSTIIEYVRDPIPKDKAVAWEKIRDILESCKSDKLDLDKAQELLKLTIETDLIS
jgi:ATP-dependent protease ClpP protease subunit